MTYTFAGITADAALWREVGYSVSDSAGWAAGASKAGEIGTSHSLIGFAASEGELVAARVTTGFNDDRALAWLVGERKRANEERSRNAAMAKHGDDLIHAARIQRMAAQIEYKARRGEDWKE